MVDVEDRDGIDLIVDRVEDSVGAAASAESPTQLAFQRLAHSSSSSRREPALRYVELLTNLFLGEGATCGYVCLRLGK